MTDISLDSAMSDAEVVSAEANDISGDADLVATLSAEVDELKLLVMDLELSRPSAFLSFYAFILAIVCLGVVLTLIAAPDLVPAASSRLPTIAAFLAVVLTYFTYAAYKRFIVDIERSRSHRAMLARAHHLLALAVNVLRDASASSIEPRAS